MAGKLHHVAVNTPNFEKTVSFFEELFDMTVKRTRGEIPERKLWFHEGIQVCETAEGPTGRNFCDHIGIGVPNREEMIRKALDMGCTAIEGKPAHWLLTPDQIVMELIEQAE